jgi:hypothetical protein
MPYDPTIDPPDVQAERRPRGLDEPPVDCLWCGDQLNIVSERGDAFEADCPTCSATVFSIDPGEYKWTTPQRAFEILSFRVATEWPFTADQASMLECLRDAARDAKSDRNKAWKGVA